MNRRTKLVRFPLLPIRFVPRTRAHAASGARATLLLDFVQTIAASPRHMRAREREREKPHDEFNEGVQSKYTHRELNDRQNSLTNLIKFGPKRK